MIARTPLTASSTASKTQKISGDLEDLEVRGGGGIELDADEVVVGLVDCFYAERFAMRRVMPRKDPTFRRGWRAMCKARKWETLVARPVLLFVWVWGR